MFCENCGNQISDKDMYCACCGAKINKRYAGPSQDQNYVTPEWEQIPPNDQWPSNQANPVRMNQPAPMPANKAAASSGIRNVYFVDFLCRLFSKENIPLCIYLVINMVIIGGIMSVLFVLPLQWGMLSGFFVYLATIVIALSPIGEFIVRFQTGCKKIKDPEIMSRLEPLFYEVYQKAKMQEPLISDSVRLYMNDDESENAKAATCTLDGYSGDIYCTNCGNLIEAGSVTKAVGHQWDNGVITKAATATQTGIKTYTCTVCKITRTEVIKALGNNTKPIGNSNKPKLKTGEKITDKSTGAVYKVTGKNTVEYVKATSKKASRTIPSTVKLKGIKCQVTSIATKAFKGDPKIKAVVIPATVRKIGKEAFAKCKNLKKITIKTTYLSSKKIGANAFKGIHAKATIKVPKKQKKAYQKLLKARGVGKKVTVK